MAISCLIGCEESQAIAIALRNNGVDAFSCDLKPAGGGHPEFHLQMDVFEAIKLKKWDFGIFHPPCTMIAGSAVQWLSHPDDKRKPFHKRRPHPLYPERRHDAEMAIKFVKDLYYSDLDRLAIENPVGILSSLWKKPDQIIQPYQFGDVATKTTCLWLKNLPKLHPTKIVSSGNRIKFKSGKSHPKWYAAGRGMNKEERQEYRSKTFNGIAQAMANQWPGVMPLTLF